MAFEREKRALLADFKMPLGLAESDTAPMLDIGSVVRWTMGAGSMPINLKQGGLTQEEWDLARECQKQIEVLSAKWPPTGQEIALLEQLQNQRNALWNKAVGIPGLTADERERLRIKLYTRDLHAGDSVLPTVTAEQIKQWTAQPPPPLPDPQQPPDEPVPDYVNPVSLMLMREFTTEKSVALIELAGKEFAEKELGEYGKQFGNFLGIAKIAVAYKKGDVSSALAKTGDFLVGMIKIPQAKFALEGGRLYADTAYQAQNKFMSECTRAVNTLSGKVGGEFDKEKFWSDFDNDCTVREQAIRKWVSYGTK